MKMSYVVDRRQIGVGFNWDGSSNRVLGTSESSQFAKIATQKEISRKKIGQESWNSFSKNILPVADQWQKQAELRRAPTEETNRDKIIQMFNKIYCEEHQLRRQIVIRLSKCLTKYTAKSTN